MNGYYDVNLKNERLEILKAFDNFVFYEEDIQNMTALKAIFKEQKVDDICNLAAQAGVRYSMEDPFSYEKKLYLY